MRLDCSPKGRRSCEEVNAFFTFLFFATFMREPFLPLALSFSSLSSSHPAVHYNSTTSTIDRKTRKKERCSTPTSPYPLPSHLPSTPLRFRNPLRYPAAHIIMPRNRRGTAVSLARRNGARHQHTTTPSQTSQTRLKNNERRYDMVCVAQSPCHRPAIIAGGE